MPRHTSFVRLPGTRLVYRLLSCSIEKAEKVEEKRVYLKMRKVSFVPLLHFYEQFTKMRIFRRQVYTLRGINRLTYVNSTYNYKRRKLGKSRHARREEREKKFNERKLCTCVSMRKNGNNSREASTRLRRPRSSPETSRGLFVLSADRVENYRSQLPYRHL